MNKKAYVTPCMQEIIINVPQILSGSVTGDGDAKIGWGGKATNETTAGSREFSIFDDEE